MTEIIDGKAVGDEVVATVKELTAELLRSGGKQPGLHLAAVVQTPVVRLDGLTRERTPRPITPSAAEQEAHLAFLKRLKEPLWLTPAFADAAQ